MEEVGWGLGLLAVKSNEQTCLLQHLEGPGIWARDHLLYLYFFQIPSKTFECKIGLAILRRNGGPSVSADEGK